LFFQERGAFFFVLSRGGHSSFRRQSSHSSGGQSSEGTPSGWRRCPFPASDCGTTSAVASLVHRPKSWTTPDHHTQGAYTSSTRQPPFAAIHSAASPSPSYPPASTTRPGQIAAS
jgi:hypothetical protein